MTFLKPRGSSASWSSMTSQTGSARLGPILATATLIVVAGFLAWKLRSQWTIPSQIQGPLSNEPSAPSSATRARVPPPAPLDAPRIAPSPGIAAVPPNAGAPAEIGPADLIATALTDLPEPVPVRDEAVREVAPAVPASLYSAADADVTPPTPIGHGGFNELPGSGRPGDRVTIEFIVNERGAVESAKVRGEPRSLGESMLFTMSLHALKTWQFRPALKDGNPVRYRQVRSFEGTATPLPPPGQRQP
jgi:hypothetical protein